MNSSGISKFIRIMNKDSEIVKAKGERKSLALNAKKESSDEECSTFRSEDENMPWRLETSRSSSREESDSGEEDYEKAKDETCLIAQASNEICLGVDLEPDEWIKDSGCSKHMMESLNVAFDGTPLPSKTSPLVDDDLDEEESIKDMCDEFAKIMHDEFEMSMMGELNFFLGLQIKQMEDGIFFNQSKYTKEMLKKFGLEDSKPMKIPMSSDTKLTKVEECESVDSAKYRGMTGTTHLGLWYPKGTGIETVVYADSDHAGDYVDRKSTSGICTFVGCCLTSWFSKKQTALAISTTEAEYVSAKKACQQALWMKQALIDYDVRLDDVPIIANPADIFTFVTCHTYQSQLIIEEMAGKEAKSTTRKIMTNDQSYYYLGITSIMVNAKNSYELKGRFLDDLHKNAFSGTHVEGAVEHIEYFLKMFDQINLPNVNQDKLRVVVFPISLDRDAWRLFDGTKGSITSLVDLTAKFFGKY
ncbi:copia protein [Tanacetum coccineum]